MPTSAIRSLHETYRRQVDELHEKRSANLITEREYALEAMRLLHSHNCEFSKIISKPVTK